MAETNPNERLEVFCDGVFAIAITLLIIEIHVPSPENIHNTAEFWLALKHLAPSIFAFVLSFKVILITWVNHHNGMKLVNKSSPSFIYANGFLLLTVVFLPFPTALLGQFILTDHAAPAVILYNLTLFFQAVAWNMIFNTALNGQFGKNEKATQVIRQYNSYGYFACALYLLFAILAIWIPLAIAVLTVVTWIFWLGLGIKLKHVKV